MKLSRKPTLALLDLLAAVAVAVGSLDLVMLHLESTTGGIASLGDLFTSVITLVFVGFAAFLGFLRHLLAFEVQLNTERQSLLTLSAYALFTVAFTGYAYAVVNARLARRESFTDISVARLYENRPGVHELKSASPRTKSGFA